MRYFLNSVREIPYSNIAMALTLYHINHISYIYGCEKVTDTELQ